MVAGCRFKAWLFGLLVPIVVVVVVVCCEDDDDNGNPVVRLMGVA